MGGAHSRPKKHLRFSSLLDLLSDSFAQIPDQRNQDRIQYSLIDIYKSAFAMFFLQDKSLLQFQRRFQEELHRNNLSTVFGVTDIPCDSQLRDVIDTHSIDPLFSLFPQIFKRLQRGKYLDQYQYLDGAYLVPIDGSGYFSSEKIQCNKCLIKKPSGSDGYRYHHMILQATLVHPDMREVLPLSLDFICNEDGSAKQDCERNSARRLLQRIKKEHPRLPLIIVGDGLYSNQPFIEHCKDLNMSYILVAKPRDHKVLYQDIDSLRESNLLDTLTVKEKGRQYHYEWVNDVFLNGNKNSIKVNFLKLTIYKGKKKTYSNAWVTDTVVTKENVQKLARGGRARWKIENENFNTLKNHGYHLDHNFGHGKNNLSQALFILNIIAFYFHQIFQLSDIQYQRARNGFSARVEYWNVIRSAFRLILLDNWEQILLRINSPPE